MSRPFLCDAWESSPPSAPTPRLVQMAPNLVLPDRCSTCCPLPAKWDGVPHPGRCNPCTAVLEWQAEQEAEARRQETKQRRQSTPMAVWRLVLPRRWRRRVGAWR